MKVTSGVIALIFSLALGAGSVLADDAAVTADPSGTIPSGVVTVTGTGFPAETAIPIHLINSEGSELTVWTARTDEAGAFTSNVLVPVTAALGTYQLHADSATPAGTSFKVAETREAAVANPTLAVEPTSTTVGRVVTVSGTGLGNDLSVPIHLVGSDGSKLTVWTARTDATGAFSANVLVPVSVGFGTYGVHAEGVAPVQTLLTVGG